MKWLNVGCGGSPHPEAINLDIVSLPGVDVVHDLDIHPWPFDDETFPQVRAVQVFEHVKDPIGFMREAWRVLKPEGLLSLSVPHWQTENAYTDPTHVRYCTERTWDYWTEGTALHQQFGPAYAGDVLFRRQRVERIGDDIVVELTRA